MVEERGRRDDVRVESFGQKNTKGMCGTNTRHKTVRTDRFDVGGTVRDCLWTCDPRREKTTVVRNVGCNNNDQRIVSTLAHASQPFDLISLTNRNLPPIMLSSYVGRRTSDVRCRTSEAVHQSPAAPFQRRLLAVFARFASITRSFVYTLYILPYLIPSSAFIPLWSIELPLSRNIVLDCR